MSVNRKIILSFVSGSLVWFILLSSMPATESVTYECIRNYLALTFGLALGGYGNSLIRQWPWVLVFVPSIPRLLGILGI